MSSRYLQPDEPSEAATRADVETAKVLQLAAPTDNPQPGDEFTLDPELLRQNLITGFDPSNSESHPYFVMRSQLLKHAVSKDEHVFAITSVQPGNGKTHIAVNLAAALSRIRPTVLIELDLRRPSIGDRLGLPSQHLGIDDYLSGTHEFAASGIHIEGFNLVVHRVRQHHDDAESLLASSRLTDMTNAVRSAENSPICIIDTPPAVVHDDMMLIAPAIDGILMVVQEARTPKRALLDTIKSLSPTPIIGSILNMSISSARPSRDLDYYYGRTRK